MRGPFLHFTYWVCEFLTRVESLLHLDRELSRNHLPGTSRRFERRRPGPRFFLWLLSRCHGQDESDADDDIEGIEQHVSDHPHIDILRPPYSGHDWQHAERNRNEPPRLPHVVKCE
jgi:hypothetical protein